jgi:hypothetical protein
MKFLGKYGEMAVEPDSVNGSSRESKRVAPQEPHILHGILERQTLIFILGGAFDFQQSVKHGVICLGQANGQPFVVQFPDRLRQRKLPRIWRVFHGSSFRCVLLKFWHFSRLAPSGNRMNSRKRSP